MFRLAKRPVFYGIVTAASVFYFHQFVLLQLWRSISGLHVVSTIMAILIIGFWHLSVVRWPRKESPANFEVSSRDGAAVGFLFFVSFVVWRVFAYANLHASVHTFGDEDHHLVTSRETWRYLQSYLSGVVPSGGGPNAYRYPGLIYFWAQFFSALSPVAGFYERFSLFFPFAGTALVAYVWGRLESLSLIAALAFALLFATSPLLLTYTTDFYLDIGHPLFALAAFAMLSHFFIGSERAAVMTAIFASLLFFVRDNALPTTVVLAVALFAHTFYKARNRRGFWRGAQLVVFTLLPPVAFLFLKTRATLVDASRLSLHNLSAQDYWGFFGYLLFYLGPFFLLGAFTRRRFLLFLMALAFVGQLFVYGLFQPGWIPWSRNYLMFVGPVAGMGLLGLCGLVGTKVGYRAGLSILSTQILFQVYSLSTQFNRNEFFHENEIRFEYRAFFGRIAREKAEACTKGIATNVPISVPWSWKEALGALGPCKLTPIEAPVYSFPDFSALVKSQVASPYLIYQWRIARTHIPVLQALPSAPPPPRELPAGLKLVFLELDPWSEGNAGLALYERTH